MDNRFENRVIGGCKQPETTTDLFLKWGNKKRLRCVRMRDPDDAADPSYAVSGRRRIRRRINSRFVDFSSDNDNNNNNKHPSLPPPPPPTRLTRNSETAVHLRSENHRKPSPEKELSTTTTKRSPSPAAVTAAGKPAASPVVHGGADQNQKIKHVWPKLYITLSNKEKEEDFMAMKGCKPPHRPKKRPKAVQRSLLLVSPGAWLTDICRERYEVVEKKNTKKRPTGLKAMGTLESDSE